MNPKVSIIMGVYNEEKAVGKTIKNVLNQTFRDFEFIVIDDKSTDFSQNIIRKYKAKDDRVILLKNNTNIGLTKSLNLGIDLAKGDYIARIDAGDLWDKEKLEKQIKFLEKNKEYVICGTQTFYIDIEGKILSKSSDKSVENEDIRRDLLSMKAIFLHPSIVFRNMKIYYREFFKYSQDLDLYGRLFFKGKLYCLPQPLTYKVVSSNLTIEKKYYQRQYQNIAYKLFKERIKHGKDKLDIGKIPVIKKSRIGLRFCKWATLFLFSKTRVSRKPFILSLFHLVLACLLYPPFMIDYFEKARNIILYKKLKLNILR
jgi:glycosyltransferase involved in cell wall biosynthesis